MNAGGYESAPATAILATSCACCGKALLDAVSVETGVGPECRRKHGFADAQGAADWAHVATSIARLAIPDSAKAAHASQDAHALANALVHFVAVHQDGAHVRDACMTIAALGYVKLARRIAQRLGAIFVEVEGASLLVKTPWSEEFTIAMRGVRGAIWDRERRVRVVPVACRDALWRVFRRTFPGALVVGTRIAVVPPVGVRAAA